jgi:hypothetical protein
MPLAPQFHRDAHDFVTLALQEERRDGGIDSAGKSDGDLHDSRLPTA